MAANPLNFKKNHADVVAAEAAIAPLLKSANITSITVDGKEVPASDAPLAAKISEMGKLLASGDRTQDAAALISANGELAGQVEAAEAKLLAEKAVTASQSQKILELTGKLNVAEGSLQTATAKNLETSNLLKSTTEAGERLTKEVAAQKITLARKCLAVGCVDFKGADGKALAANCSDADLAAASKDLTFDALAESYSGALNSAASKLGINIATLPGQPVTSTTPAPKVGNSNLKGLELAQADFKAKQKAAKTN